MSEKRNTEERKTHTLVGTWVNGDEYATDVEYHVSQGSKGFAVRAIDRFDGEEAEVHDVKWDGEALSFATHCASTGRFVKCRLLAVSPNRVDFTYTYTQQEIWHRKEAEPIPLPNRLARQKVGSKTSRGRGS